MTFIKYKKYVPDLADEISMEDLMNALSDHLLQSGFENPYSDFYDVGDDQSLERLKQAIAQALMNSELFDEETKERLKQMQAEGGFDELLEKLLERMEQENYITVDQPYDQTRQSNVSGQVGEAQQPGEAKFEVTDKGLDFLGYRTLRDLLGSLGKSSFGRHDTRDLATGVEASGSSKPYEFGDTLNLDI